MAYNQQHDPYYGTQNQQQRGNDSSLVPDVLPTAQPYHTAGGYQQTYDDHPQWDSHSTKSYNSQYAGSQVHLNPNGYDGGSGAPYGGGDRHNQYEMSQVTLTNASVAPGQVYPPGQQSQQQQQQQQPPYGGPSFPPQQQYPQQQRNVQFQPAAAPLREQSTGGYSAARERMLRRRSVRQVELQQGNLVLDMPVPSSIVPAGAKAEEQTTLRYTAATCDPDEFMRKKYTVRPYLYGRQTELFIVMTMYNEDEVLFTRTMNAVIKNIVHLCSRSKSKTWGAEGWKKVVVCVVSDGRNKVNKRTLHVLSLMGCYQEGVAKDSVAGQDVTAHIFEYTTTVVVTEAGEVSQSGCPIQIIFCLKEQNKKKLNSHRWFFNAFGPLVKPNVCILLDVGTKPTGTSIYELWKCFDRHKGVGGACGEICVDTGRGCGLLLKSPLAASQNFEYKISNILDKPLESVFGYISVLPGAFSAYRYKALLNGPDGRGPLASYFKGETMHGGGATGAGLFERNMYLAEDRILCFEIVTKRKEAWVLKYVKSAKASTDVPTSVPEFISQRRRWLNGSFFACVHATVFFFRIWTSGQNFLRKIILQIEFIYNAVQLLFSWISLANFYLAFFFLVSSATSNSSSDAFKFISLGAGDTVFEVFLKLYIALLFVVVVCSLGNRPQGSKWTYVICIVLFGFCNVITLWCAGYTIYLQVPHSINGWKHVDQLFEKNKTFRELVVSLAATYGLYFIGSIMHGEPWHMFTSFLQYMFYLPSYVNILMTYAMCNLHDVSWGTKGQSGTKDLGGAKKVQTKDGKEVLEVELPAAREDAEQLWNAARSALRNKPPAERERRDAETKQADRDANSRTNVVLAWVATNVTLILVFTSTAFIEFIKKHIQVADEATFNPYLTFLFMALAGLSAIRFTGSLLYLILRAVGL